MGNRVYYKATGPYQDDPLYDWFYDRAKFCLITQMRPEYYDEMTQVERAAWIEAYNDIQKEANG